MFKFCSDKGIKVELDNCDLCYFVLYMGFGLDCKVY